MHVQVKAEAPAAARTAADLYPQMSKDLTCFARRLPALAGSLVVHAFLIAGLGLLVSRSQSPVCEESYEAAWIPYEGPWEDIVVHGPGKSRKPVPVAEFFDPDLAPPLAWEEALAPEPDLAFAAAAPPARRPDILAGLPGFFDEEEATRALPPWWGTLAP